MSQIQGSDLLDLAEEAKSLAFFDVECTGTKNDYNSALVVSVKPYKSSPTTFTVDVPGADKALVRAARDELLKYKVWVSFYGKGFDWQFLNGRLALHRMNPLPRHHHLDLYWIARGRFVTARRSMAHLSEWLDCPKKKYTISPEVWNLVLRSPARGLKILKRRCEQDCAELEDLYDRLKPWVENVSR